MRFAGLDIALKRDYTALVIIESQPSAPYRVVFIKQWPHMNWKAILSDLEALYTKWRWHVLAVDQTSIGEIAVEDIVGKRIPVEGILFTAPKKEDMLTNLREMLQTHKLLIAENAIELLLQMEEQERIITDAGHVQFRHPEGRHDDQFWALALACYMTKTAQEHGIVAI